MWLTDDAYVYHSKCNGVHLAVFLVSQGKTYFNNGPCDGENVLMWSLSTLKRYTYTTWFIILLIFREWNKYFEKYMNPADWREESTSSRFHAVVLLLDSRLVMEHS